MDSILTSIKKLLGIAEDQTNFDADIIMHINSVFMILTDLGVGPAEGFTIKDEYSYWDSFIPNGQSLELVKSYMYLKVRLLFAPPLNSSVLTSMEKSISEYEWRLNAKAESMESNTEE